MKTVVVANHPYHLSAVNKQRWQYNKLIYFGNENDTHSISPTIEKHCLPLFEPLPIRGKLLLKVKFLKLLQQIAQEPNNEFIFFGCQDLLSWKLLLSIDANSATIVPDNIEFYLRPESISQIPTLNRSRPKLRSTIKSILYGVPPSSNEIAEFSGRFIYSLRGRHTTAPIFIQEFSHRKNNCSTSDCTYISQPYYIDYNIDCKFWTETICKSLKRYNCTKIRFHPRDSPEYRENIRRNGIEESKQDSDNLIGLFSTHLFQCASSGLNVTSFMNDVIHLFPKDYQCFVTWFASTLNIDLNNSNTWTVNAAKFRHFDKSIQTSSHHQPVKINTISQKAI
ncbi:hypothetical protein ACFFKJ_18845 [Pelagicoccus mobilis]